MVNRPDSAHKLAQHILGSLKAPEPPAEAAEDAAWPHAGSGDAETASADAVDLIELYFTVEEPLERELIFEQLARLSTPVVEEFFVAMMHEDDDVFMRAAAAATLVRWAAGEASGASAHGQAALAHLETIVQAPQDPVLHSFAIEVLTQLRGAAIYDTLKVLWLDRQRSASERREAMLGMEMADTGRALADFIAFIDSLDDVARLPDQEVEACMACFGRHAHVAAIPALQRLRERMVAQPFRDPRDRTELLAFVDEGLALLVSD